MSRHFKLVPLLLMTILCITACGKASFGDREAAYDYLIMPQPRAAKKPFLHSLSYYRVWCAENEPDFWPKAVAFCKPFKGISNELCVYVNIVENARVGGRADCDPS